VKKVHILLYAILVVAVLMMYSCYNSARTNCMELEATLDDSRTHISTITVQLQKQSKYTKQVEAQLEKAQRERTTAVQNLYARDSDLNNLSLANAELKSQMSETREQLEFAHRCANESRYDTSAQILGLPTCTLTDAQNHICETGFTDSSGKKFYIGGPGSSAEVHGFICSVEQGKTITLPADFAAYLNRSIPKTNAQLLAFKPTLCEFVDLQKECGLFEFKNGMRTARLVIGGQNAERDVEKFLKTLEEGKTYALPDAFREYLKKKEK